MPAQGLPQLGDGKDVVVGCLTYTYRRNGQWAQLHGVEGSRTIPLVPRRLVLHPRGHLQGIPPPMIDAKRHTVRFVERCQDAFGPSPCSTSSSMILPASSKLIRT